MKKTILIAVVLGCLAGLASTLLVPDATIEVNVYSQTGFKMPTRYGDTTVWFRHSAARDTFQERLMANPELYRLFDLPSWAETEEVRRLEKEAGDE